MKYNQFFYIFLLMIGLTLVLLPVQGNIESAESFGTWQILEWNDEHAVAWDWGVSSFVTSNESYINYTLSHHESSNFTHPSGGSIIVGNLTTQTTNNKTAEVLLLSIYGWFPGLITSADNWPRQEQVATSAAQGEWTLGTLNIIYMIYSYKGINRDAITFEYAQDPSIGNQNTTIIYDLETGVLLEGWTEIYILESYILHLKLTNTNIIDLNPPTTSLITIFPVTIGLALVILGKKRK